MIADGLGFRAWGTQGSGLWAFNADGAMSKRFHAGRASQSGSDGRRVGCEGLEWSYSAIRGS